MSGSSGEKTELPTPKKERDARQKGQVARSQEVVTTISLFGVIAGIWIFGGDTWSRIVGLMDTVAMLAADPTVPNLKNGISIAFWEGVSIMMPILGLTLLFGIAANYIQIGSLFAFENLTPKLEKISPAKGFKRIFSMKQMVETLKSILKIIFLSILLFFVIRSAIGPYSVAVSCGMPCLSQVTVHMLYLTLAYSALVFLIVAGFDFMYQKHAHTKSLMMTKEEVKREYKESEGDPMVKGQRKQLAQELVMSDGGKQARKATAVIVNPTHFAVAIRFEEGKTPLPMLVAKGRNKQAYYIRSEAEAAGVPIFSNPPIARLLHADCMEGEYVPDEAFDVVAEILAWVSKHKDDLYHGRLHHGVIDMINDEHRPAA